MSDGSIGDGLRVTGHGVANARDTRTKCRHVVGERFLIYDGSAVNESLDHEGLDSSGY